MIKAIVFTIVISIVLSLGLMNVGISMGESSAQKMKNWESMGALLQEIEKMPELHQQRKPATLLEMKRLYRIGVDSYRFTLRVGDGSGLSFDSYFTKIFPHARSWDHLSGKSPEELKKDLASAYWVYPLPEDVKQRVLTPEFAKKKIAALCRPGASAPRCTMLVAEYSLPDGATEVVDTFTE